jgi:hypothetical protein
MNPDEIPEDELFQLEWKIAQRADALMRQAGGDPKSAMDHWNEAEHEIWGAIASAPVRIDLCHVSASQNMVACGF